MNTRPPVSDWTSDFDHLHPAWIEDPFPIWEELRQKCPVAHTDRFRGVYFPSRYDDVRAIAMDTEHFSSRRIIVREEPPPKGIPAPPITSDPPYHKSAKQVLLPPFTPAAVARHEARTRGICRELIAKFDAKGCDGAVQYAQEIPPRVIAHMLGIPEDDGDLFRKWIYEVLELGITDIQAVIRASGEMQAYFLQEIAKRRDKPTDDLISYLMKCQERRPAADGRPRHRLVAPLAHRRHRHHLERHRLVPVAPRQGARRTASGSSTNPSSWTRQSRNSCAPMRRSPWRARWSRRRPSTAAR